VSHDIRDEVIDYVRYWSERTELAATRLVRWMGISRSKYYQWRSRYGKVNEHPAVGGRFRGTSGWRSGRRKRLCGFTWSILGTDIAG